MALQSLYKSAGQLAAAVAVLSALSNAAAAFPTFHLSALAASAKKARIKTEPSYRTARRHAFCYMERIPIYMEQMVEAQSSTGVSVNCRVTLDQVPPNGTSVQINCDRPDLVTSPSGSWPYILVYPAGSSETRSVVFNGRLATLSTPVRFIACPTGLDINDPANWSATSYMTLNVATAK